MDVLESEQWRRGTVRKAKPSLDAIETLAGGYSDPMQSGVNSLFDELAFPRSAKYDKRWIRENALGKPDGFIGVVDIGLIRRR